MQIESESERHLLRALVAEDDPGVRRLIAGMLRLDGWDVPEVQDGDEAVSVGELFRPDALADLAARTRAALRWHGADQPAE